MLFKDLSMSSIETFFEDNKYLKSGNFFSINLNDINPLTGSPRYTPLIAISIMVFYVYAAQCMATFAIVRSETNSFKWPIYMIIYMTALAYLGSLVVYQGGLMLGFT